MQRKLVLIGVLIVLAYSSAAVVFQLVTMLNQEQSDREYSRIKLSERDFLDNWAKSGEIAPGVYLGYDKDPKYLELQRMMSSNRANRPKSNPSIIVLGGAALALAYATVATSILLFQKTPQS